MSDLEKTPRPDDETPSPDDPESKKETPLGQNEGGLSEKKIEELTEWANRILPPKKQ